MSRSRKALTGLAAGYIGTAINIVGNFVLVPIILAYIDRENYGLWTAVAQAMGYLGLLELGLGMGVVRYVASTYWRDDPEELSRQVSSAFVLYCVVGAAFLALGLAASWALPVWFRVPDANLAVARVMVLILACWGGVRFPFAVFSDLLIGIQQLALHRGLAVLATGLNIALSIAFLKLGWGLLALPAALAVSGLIRLMVVLWCVKRLIPGLHVSLSYIDRGWIKTLLTFSVYTFLLKVAWIVIFSTDHIVIGRIIGLGAVTTYGLTFRLPNSLLALITRISNIAVPGLAELDGTKDLKQLRGVVLDLSRVVVGLGACMAVIVVALNSSFVRLWVGPENDGGMLLSSAFGLLCLYQVGALLSWDVLNGLGRIQGMSMVGIIEAALNIVLSVFLAIQMGLIGVALGTLIAGVTTSGWYRPLEVCRALGIGKRELLESGLWRALVPLAPASLAALGVRAGMAIDNWGGLVAGAIAIGFAGGAGFWLLTLDSEGRRRYWTRIRSVTTLTRSAGG